MVIRQALEGDVFGDDPKAKRQPVVVVGFDILAIHTVSTVGTRMRYTTNRQRASPPDITSGVMSNSRGVTWSLNMSASWRPHSIVTKSMRLRSGTTVSDRTSLGFYFSKYTSLI